MPSDFDTPQALFNATHNIDEIVGRSPAFRAVLDQVNLVATTDSTVLLLGETGTGKELIARAIHSRSLRKNRPLIKVDCAALPAGLVDSRLFGHEKGAFTGAIKQRIGRFELANTGSILLDEIGDTSADTQAKLLRVLQEHEVERLGGHSAVKVDVRVIAATNRDLQQRVARGTFREDLYYRLNVFPLRVLALRERLEDIPILVHHFLARFASKLGREIPHVPSQIMCRFLEYSWPGNVRELENVIERAVIVSNGPDLRLAAESLSPSIAVAPAQNGRLRPARHPSAISENPEPTALVVIERNHILNILRRTGWRIEGLAGAAHALNLKPSTLRSRMKKFGINRSSGCTKRRGRSHDSSRPDPRGFATPVGFRSIEIVRCPSSDVCWPQSSGSALWHSACLALRRSCSTAASANGLNQPVKPFQGQTLTRLHVTFAHSTGQTDHDNRNSF